MAPRPLAALPLGAALLTVLVSCATREVAAPVASLPTAPHSPALGIAQTLHRFVVCAGSECPRPTPKTRVVGVDARVLEAGKEAASPPPPDLPTLPATPQLALKLAPRIEELTIPFAYASAELPAKLTSETDALFQRARTAEHVTVRARTDASGDSVRNDALAQRRALSVRSRLVLKYDVPAERISVDARGNFGYVASNDTAAGRARNRRVELELRFPTGRPVTS